MQLLITHTGTVVILAVVKLGDLREGSSLKFGDLRDEIILYLNIFNTGFKIFLFYKGIR